MYTADEIDAMEFKFHEVVVPLMIYAFKKFRERADEIESAQYDPPAGLAAPRPPDRDQGTVYEPNALAGDAARQFPDLDRLGGHSEIVLPRRAQRPVRVAADFDKRFPDAGRLR